MSEISQSDVLSVAEGSFSRKVCTVSERDSGVVSMVNAEECALVDEVKIAPDTERFKEFLDRLINEPEVRPEAIHKFEIDEDPRATARTVIEYFINENELEAEASKQTRLEAYEEELVEQNLQELSKKLLSPVE